MESNRRSGDKWITSTDVPDPDVSDVALGWKVIVRPMPVVKEKTEGGIILANSTQKNLSFLTNAGKVLGMGDLAFKHESMGGEPWVEVGDYVVFGKFVGERFSYKGVKLILLSDKQISLKIDDYKDIDPTAGYAR